MSGNCDGILADAMIGVSYFTNLSRVDSDGTLVCSALPLAKGINIQRSGDFPGGAEEKGWWSARLLTSRATGLKVIGSQVACASPMAASMARLGITLDLHWFDYLLREHPAPRGAVITVFDRNGVVLATNDRQSRARLCRRRAEGRPAR